MTAIVSGFNNNCNNNNKKTSLTLAKQKFVEAVASGINDLMKYGYSRERATATLLRELRKEDETTPTEEEIFHMMQFQSIGLADAEKALTVSKALRRVMKTKRVSAVEAIDDLTSRLSLTNLMASPSSQQVQTRKPSPPKRLVSANTMPNNSLVSPATTSATNHRKIVARKLKVRGGNKKLEKVLKVATNRKRSLSESEKDEKQQPPRKRADSVVEKVNAKMAKSETAVGPNVRKRSLVVVDGPSATAATATPAAATQPMMKRTRTEV